MMINLPKPLFLSTPACHLNTKLNMEVPHHSADELSFSDSHVSPIHRLPLELLQNIFLLIVNDVPDCPSIFSFINITIISGNFTSPPLIFTRVCSLWRVVAHSTTGHWSRIQVTLPGGNKPLKPFLPCLLQYWLSRSGSQPLTLNIHRIGLPCHLHGVAKCGVGSGYRPLSRADSRLLEILQSESRRWETVVGVLSGDEWPSPNLDTPQLRTLKYSLPNLRRFNAPNLLRLHISQWFSDIHPIPTCKKLRHLHLQQTSFQIIRSISVTFPLLETIVVADVFPYHGARSHSATHHPCLESMTLPLPSNPDNSHWFTEIFDGLHLPVLRKLTLVGDPNKMRIDHIIAALAVTATCNVEVIDFQTTMSQDEVDVDMVEPLLSVVREVSVRGELLRCRSPRND